MRTKDKFVILRDAVRLQKTMRNIALWYNRAKAENAKESPSNIWAVDFPTLTLYRLLEQAFTDDEKISTSVGLTLLQKGLNSLIASLREELQPIIDDIVNPLSIIVRASGPNIREYLVDTDYQPVAEAIAELLTDCQYTVTRYRDGFIISWSYDTTD